MGVKDDNSNPQGGVVVEKKKSHAIISFSHPKHNILTLSILSDLIFHIKSLSENIDIKAIVIKSKGENFCAGVNLKEVKLISPKENIFFRLVNLLNCCINSPKLIISYFQGKAIGGGVGLLASSDYCFSDQDASVRLSELSIGLAPCIVAPLIIKKTSNSFFQTMSWNPEKIFNATMLKEKGFIHQIGKDKKQAEDFLDRFLKKVSEYKTNAIEQTKQLFWQDRNWQETLMNNAKKTTELALSNFK